MANQYPLKSRLLPYIQSSPIQPNPIRPQPLSLSTHPRNNQPLRQCRRRNSRLGRPGRNTTRIKRRTAIIFQLIPHAARKDGPRRDRRRADEIRVLDRAAAFAGCECEAGGAGGGRGEGGAGAADVPRAGADDAAVGGTAAGRGDLEGALARERGSGRGGGAGAGGCGGCGGGAGAGFGEVLDTCCGTV